MLIFNRPKKVQVRILKTEYDPMGTPWTVEHTYVGRLVKETKESITLESCGRFMTIDQRSIISVDIY